MAFDLYLNNKRFSIHHDEEDLFGLVNDDEEYPVLNWIWEEYYNGPRIPPEKSSQLVNELISVRSRFSDDKGFEHILGLIDRLLPLFSRAYNDQIEIKCLSD